MGPRYCSHLGQGQNSKPISFKPEFPQCNTYCHVALMRIGVFSTAFVTSKFYVNVNIYEICFNVCAEKDCNRSGIMSSCRSYYHNVRQKRTIAKRFPVNENSFPLHDTRDRLVRNFSLNRSVTPCE